MCGRWLIWWPDPVTHSFSFSWNKKKERKTKRGVSKSERKSESGGWVRREEGVEREKAKRHL